jgi:hypothetical protein
MSVSAKVNKAFRFNPNGEICVYPFVAQKIFQISVKEKKIFRRKIFAKNKNSLYQLYLNL